MTDSKDNLAPSVVKQKIEIHQSYKDAALERARKAVNGNQFDPNELNLIKFEGEILNFEAKNDVSYTTRFIKKSIPGRNESAIKCANESEVKTSAYNEYEKLRTDGDFEKKVRELILKREDLGFAAKNLIIPIPFWHKEYVIHEECSTCRTQGVLRCQNCAGKGFAPCNQCNGSGMRYCSYCNGNKMVAGPNGQRQICMTCNGTGRSSCNQCNQTGRINCRTCAGRGVTTCSQCQGLKWISHLYVYDMDVILQFTYPKEQIPADIAARVEKEGYKIKEFAEIKINTEYQIALNARKEEEIPLEERQKEQLNYIKIPIFYNVMLPYAHIELAIKEKSYYAFIFGTNGIMTHVSPFVDDVLKEGVRKLDDAKDDRGNIINNLRIALSYRTIKEAFLYTLKHSKSKALKQLLQANTIGLSDSLAKKLITNSEIIIAKLSHKPKNTALIISALFYAALFGIYLITPLRNSLHSLIQNYEIMTVTEISIIIGCIFLGNIFIQSYASKKVKSFLKSTQEDATRVSNINIKLGQHAYLNAGLYLAITLIISMIAKKYGHTIPSLLNFIF